MECVPQAPGWYLKHERAFLVGLGGVYDRSRLRIGGWGQHLG
jgi:hypothetical protein